MVREKILISAMRRDKPFRVLRNSNLSPFRPFGHSKSCFAPMQKAWQERFLKTIYSRKLPDKVQACIDFRIDQKLCFGLCRQPNIHFGQRDFMDGNVLMRDAPASVNTP
jgi:hypothetical protein